MIMTLHTIHFVYQLSMAMYFWKWQKISWLESQNFSSLRQITIGGSVETVIEPIVERRRESFMTFLGLFVRKWPQKTRSEFEIGSPIHFQFFFWGGGFCAPKFNKNPGWIASRFRLRSGNFVDQITTDGFGIKGTVKTRPLYLTESRGGGLLPFGMLLSSSWSNLFSSLCQISSGRGWLWLPLIGKLLVTLSNVCLFGILPTPVLSSILTSFYLRYIL